MDNITESYCPGASDFQRVYIKLHGYIALVICILGSVANTVNIAVLSRREMASHTNSILTALAVADLLVMLEYIPFTLHMYIPLGPPMSSNNYGWAVFVYFHSIFSQTFHTISMWLTITLAVWRYIAIKFPQKNKTWCTKENTTRAIVGAYLMCPIICLPIYFAMKIDEIPADDDDSTNSSEKERNFALQMSDNGALVKGIFWIYSVILKLIPCLVLSWFIVCLIKKMNSTEKRRQELLQKSKLKPKDVEKTQLHEAPNKKQIAGRTDRTTRMMVALLGLFLITEVPQGLFGLLSALAPHFFEMCYAMFGEVWDILALISSAVNFVLYCSMSRQFRNTFARLATDMINTLFKRKGAGRNCSSRGVKYRESNGRYSNT